MARPGSRPTQTATRHANKKLFKKLLFGAGAGNALWRAATIENNDGHALITSADASFMGLEEMDGEQFDEVWSKLNNESVENAENGKEEYATNSEPQQDESHTTTQTTKKKKKKKGKKRKLAEMKAPQVDPTPPSTAVVEQDEALELISADEPPTILEGNAGDASSAIPEPTSIDMSAWESFMLHPLLMKGLQHLKFSTPTPIQQVSLTAALRDRKDIIGAAETGSGKTLAFGLPILHTILREREAHPEQYSEPTRPLRALILAPTRELAIQVRDHLAAVAHFTDIKVVTVIGGMAVPKQQRLLSRQPEVVVATPGQLWRLMQDGEQHLVQLQQLRFLVLDEADRMVEKGHFKELDSILRVLYDDAIVATEALDPEEVERREWKKSEKKRRLKALKNVSRRWQEADKDEDMQLGEDSMEVDMVGEQEEEGANEDSEQEDMEESEGDDAEEKEEQQEVSEEHDTTDESPRHSGDSKGRQLQTFVFSATLTLSDEGRQRVHQQRKEALLDAKRSKKARMRALKRHSQNSERLNAPMDQLLHRLRFYHKVELLDLSTRHVVVRTLDERKLKCPDDQKDMYLYYMLLQHATINTEGSAGQSTDNKDALGLSLVFANSIDTLRKLYAILNALRLPVFSLHASMAQKQRLRNLERFRDTPGGILLATDVAARGLDIPAVRHVFHYHLPRTAEIYVHRCGRTARATASGVSVMLVGPGEISLYRKICKALHTVDVADYYVENDRMPQIVKRVRLARLIDERLHALRKEKAKRDWLNKVAKEADLDVEDLLDEANAPAGSDEAAAAVRRRKQLAAEARQLQAQLDELLKLPLIPRGFSRAFVTLNPELFGKDVPTLMAAASGTEEFAMAAASHGNARKNGKRQKKRRRTQ